MQIASWNVNGLRAACNANLLNVLDIMDVDVICLQEIRLQENQIPTNFLEFCNNKGYKFVANYGMRPGYAGTMTMYRGDIEDYKISFMKDISPRYDMYEGRVVIIVKDGYKIINSYVMNSKNDASRKDERVAFNGQILDELSSDKTILCGDLNAVATDMDIYRPSLQIAGNYPFERQFLKDILDKSYVDAFRMLHIDAQKYTWFSRYPGSEENNKGMRLDYFMVSGDLKDNIEKCEILQSYTSDHKPIWLKLK